MSDSSKFGIILNPEAGRGRAKHSANKLIEYLHTKKIHFRLERTNSPGHAIEIARRMKKEFETIIAAGGDGTVNEVMTGMIGSKSALAILPIGSGNDFNKMIGIPINIFQAVDTILRGKNKWFDLGEVDYWNQNGEKKKRNFINTLGIGLDAEIAIETKKISYLRGLPLYMLAAIKALRRHIPNEYKVSDRNKSHIEKAFLICIGNGKYEGGGFKLLPKAVPDDSLLDVCLIRNMPVWNALCLVPALIKGTFNDQTKISQWKSKEIKIESDIPFALHSDGEILEEKAVRVKVKMASRQINIVIPFDYKYVL